MRERFRRFPAGKIITGCIAIVILFSACTEDPTFVGKNILPTSDNIIMRNDTSAVIDAWTTAGTPVVTSANSIMMLGSTRDEIFGFTRARFMAPVVNYFNASLETGLTIDSLVLTMKVDTSYGDAVAQTVRAYEVTTDSIGYNRTYYSDEDPSNFYNPVEIGHTVFHPATDTAIRIRITNPDYLNKFYNSPDSIFLDPVDFMNVFKGVFISTDPITGNGGSLMAVNLTGTSQESGRESGMRLYYKNDTTRSVSDTITNIYSIFFPTSSANSTNPLISPNFFTHDYTGARAAANLDLPDANDSLQFISGLGGLDVRLSFPEIGKWLDSTHVAINKAELIIPVDTTIINPDLFPKNLALLEVNDDGSYSFLNDFRIDQSSGTSGTPGNVFNGYYGQIIRGAYVFNIGYHFQDYIEGKVDNMDFILLNGEVANLKVISPQTLNAQSPARTILKSPGSSGIRLRIIYTEY
ncbi:MAG TPA: DUF4270 family protein [Bacteroidales bacterium]|nr:DUF4270 family protein [Bacteroidales bacterium]